MRIITGSAKGRKIKAPEGLDTRPTADRVKQSIFNIIALKIREAKVLDLFAGTGNLGLEAISQGASSCTFVEHNKTTFGILNENIEMLNFNSRVEKYNGEAIASLGNLANKGRDYDVIFLDPPYGKGLIEAALIEIDKKNMLTQDGLIVSEYDVNDVIPEKIGGLKIYRTIKYGRTKISLWERGI